MKIRPATLADVSALVALNEGVHALHAGAVPEVFRQQPPKEWVADAFRKAIAAPSSYWLLAEEKQVVAFLSAEFRERAETWYMISHHVCYLGGIAVAPPFRRQGIARALLAALQREAKARGVNRVELDVWSFNDQARKAFARLGFHSVMERMVLSPEKPNAARKPRAPRATKAKRGRSAKNEK